MSMTSVESLERDHGGYKYSGVHVVEVHVVEYSGEYSREYSRFF